MSNFSAAKSYAANPQATFIRVGVQKLCVREDKIIIIF